MSEFDDLRISDEYLKIIDILKKDVKIRKYFEDMKDQNFPSHEDYQKVYDEFTQYQDKMFILLRRRIKLEKILNGKNNIHKTK